MTYDELEPGHKYSYVGLGRAGTVYAAGPPPKRGPQVSHALPRRDQPDLATPIQVPAIVPTDGLMLTTKPGCVADWATANQAGLRFTHATADCSTCQTATARRGHPAAVDTNVIDITARLPR